MTAINYKWTKILALVTPILALISLFLMGGGHGWYTPAMVLFPLGMVQVIWADQLSYPFLLIGLLQYPFYGFLIDKAESLEQRKKNFMLLLAGHILLVVIIISFKSSNWR